MKIKGLKVPYWGIFKKGILILVVISSKNVKTWSSSFCQYFYYIKNTSSSGFKTSNLYFNFFLFNDMCIFLYIMYIPFQVYYDFGLFALPGPGWVKFCCCKWIFVAFVIRSAVVKLDFALCNNFPTISNKRSGIFVVKTFQLSSSITSTGWSISKWKISCEINTCHT